MPNGPTEQDKAALSIQRGKNAASLSAKGQFLNPQAQQKFISAQGDAEAKGKLDAPKMDQLASEGSLKIAGYHKGVAKVPKTGPANLEKGEAVIPKDAAKKHADTIDKILGGDKMDSENKSEGRNSEYRKVYVARKQSRSGGGNKPVTETPEKHDSKKAEKSGQPSAKQAGGHVKS